VHEYEVTSWALYYERSTSHNFVVLHYIEPTASVFYTQNIWLHSHVLKCLLHALSEGKNKKFTPLRQYDVTGFIYAKKFFHHRNQRPRKPRPPHWLQLNIFYPSNYISDNACQKSLGHFQKIMKTIAFSAFQPSRLDASPLPPKTMLVCSLDTWRYCARKIFPLPHVLLSVTNIV